LLVFVGNLKNALLCFLVCSERLRKRFFFYFDSAASKAIKDADSAYAEVPPWRLGRVLGDSAYAEVPPWRLGRVLSDFFLTECSSWQFEQVLNSYLGRLVRCWPAILSIVGF